MKIKSCSNTRQKRKEPKQIATAAAEISDGEDIALEIIDIGRP